MARPKRPSDETYNARRRAKRALVRAEKAGNTELASSLREIVKASYVRNQPGRTVLQSTSTSNQPTTQTVQQAKPAQTSTRQSRPKRPSDELYNERRRLRRQAARLEREAQKETGKAREFSEGMARYLRKQAEAGKKLTAEQRQSELDRLERIRKVSSGADKTRFRIKRRNAIFIQQMNAAGTEGADSVIDDTRKSVFWAATKGLWPKGSNVPRNERYEKIVEHFYLDNTSDSREFRQWLRDEKGTTAIDVFGDLQLIYEYLTEELNDPAMYYLPDVPYKTLMDMVRTAM